MIVTARYGSHCPTCGLWIFRGERVVWSRSKRATHVACPAPASNTASKPLSTTPPDGATLSVVGQAYRNQKLKR